MKLTSTVISNQAAECSVVQNSSTTTATLPRGFKSGWTKDQRRHISSLLHSDNQQQPQQDRPPECAGDQTTTAATEVPPENAVECPIEGRGNVTSPGAPPVFLSAGDVDTLGAPGGGEIDPAMTAIFKVRRKGTERYTQTLSLNPHPSWIQCSMLGISGR